MVGESARIPPPNDEENNSCNDEAHSSAISSEQMGHIHFCWNSTQFNKAALVTWK
jgi:hypothetical protein